VKVLELMIPCSFVTDSVFLSNVSSWGKLVPLPPEITDGMAGYTPPAVISHNTPTRNYKVLFALAHSI
jgi:hypothetical protein